MGYSGTMVTTRGLVTILTERFLYYIMTVYKLPLNLNHVYLFIHVRNDIKAVVCT